MEKLKTEFKLFIASIHGKLVVGLVVFFIVYGALNALGA